MKFARTLMLAVALAAALGISAFAVGQVVGRLACGCFLDRANPQRVRELVNVNPRYVFFREEPLSDLDAQFGPRGAQGVALTPGRSIAVDPGSIPYGTPVWLSTQGPAGRFNKLVLAQDTGSAIVGAVRADYFTGWGDDALALAAGLKQPLQLWALWPKP